MKMIASGTWYLSKKSWLLKFFVFQQQPVLLFIKMQCLLHCIKIIARFAFLPPFNFFSPSVSLSLPSFLPPFLLPYPISLNFSFFSFFFFFPPSLLCKWFLSITRQCFITITLGDYLIVESLFPHMKNACTTTYLLEMIYG